jgi:hypothetical protein
MVRGMQEPVNMSTPPFVDAAHAAQMLHVTTEVVLDLVKSGKLRRFGGRPDNPFVRSADVAALATELGVQQVEEPPKRVKSASARVQSRLTADSRWADVSAGDIREWAARAEPARRQAARKAAILALQQLEIVLRVLDDEHDGEVDEGPSRESPAPAG